MKGVLVIFSIASMFLIVMCSFWYEVGKKDGEIKVQKQAVQLGYGVHNGLYFEWKGEGK